MSPPIKPTRWLCRLLLCGALSLQGCATDILPEAESPNTRQNSTTVSAIEDGTFIPEGAFSVPAGQKTPRVTYGNDLSASAKDSTFGRAVTLKPTVWLYASPTSKKYHEHSGINFALNIRIWEIFLKKYQIPFKTITRSDRLGSLTPGVLILPSLVALSAQEKQAITNFRSQGGSVLSTWLTGVRDEKGIWQGFSFMKSGLDVVVVGDTQAEEEENFMMAYGGSPILHSLTAGQRIWLERLKGIYPLRLQGQQAAAQIMDWSRLSVGEKVNTILVFGEQRQTSGVLSRSVALGYPERLWMSADPKAMEAIAHNALTWLARLPQAQLAEWPHPYTSALTIAVDAPEVVDDLDVNFADLVSDTGGKATFYIPSVNATPSAPAIKKLQAAGHELGYMADRFEGFMGQPASVQATRLDTMQQEFEKAELSTGSTIGFSPPMGSQDKTTQDLLNQRGFTYYVASMSETEARLPVLIPRIPGANNAQSPLVMLPRTQNGPEDLMNEGDPDEGLQRYLAEFESATAMGGLSYVRFPNQTLLADDQLDAIFGQFKKHAQRLWMAPNGAIARWWLERNRVNVTMGVANGSLGLSITVDGVTPLSLPLSVVVSLPYANDTLRLTPLDQADDAASMVALDPWRVAISWGKLTPGTHRWHMQFERSTTPISQ